LTRGNETFWRRPGKQAGISASTGHAGDRDRLYVWSTSTEFDPEVPYTKLGAYAVLNHGGDMSKAAKALYEKGYGKQAEHPRDVIDDLAEVYGPKHQPETAEGGEAPTPAPQPIDAPTPIVEISEPIIYTRTDDGNALRFVDAYREQLRWIPQRSTWAVWDGHRWNIDDGIAVAHELAKNLARRLPQDSKIDATHKQRSLSRNGLNNMLALATTHPAIWSPLSRFDANPWELNTPAGLLDLRHNTLRKPDPKTLCLRSTAVAPVFEPAPQWETFLDQTFTGDATMVTFIQRLLGSTLIGEVREQALPFLHGPGANGKTTLMNVVQRLVGTGQTGYSTTVPAEILLASATQRHPTEIAELAGIRIAVASELEPGQKFAEAKVKMLTGSDQISARFMHQDFFTFTPSHHLFLLGNHEPDVKAGGPAFWRRMLKIPFENIVPKEQRDPGLEDRLVAEEGPQILAWIIQGARAYLESGLCEPETVRVATDAYEEGQDTVRQFVEDDCVTGEASRQDLHIPVAALRKAYESWCSDNGVDPVNAKEITQRLRTLGIRSSRGGHRGTRYYDGIRLKDDGAQIDLDSPWGDLGGGAR
jgi:putative DNA primase/helicase